MKNIKKILFVILLITPSCSQDFLNRDPLDQFGEETVWTDLALMETFVNNIYWNLYHGFDGKIGMSMLCDESVRASDRGASNVVKSMINPGNYDVYTQVGQRKLCWDHLFLYVRACNIFFENSRDRTYPDMELLTRLTGEVHFLRAFIYYFLAVQYGGVPVIDKVFALNDDFFVPRDPLEKVIKFVVDDCDAATALLKTTNIAENRGRATKGAALALKARMLLWAASELANNSSWATGYSNPEYIAYTSGNRTDRWQAAKDAAKAVMDLGIYNLHKANPSPDDDIVANLDETYLLKETVEDIFVRYFLPKTTDTEVYAPGLQYGSGGYHCQGSNNPSQTAVDFYEMNDGSKFDWNNPEHKAAPYKNREPRFYSNILYDGAQWRSRPDDLFLLDPLGILQTGYYMNADGTRRGGLDTRSAPSPSEDWNCTYSGYYQKKHIDPSVACWFNHQDLPWRHFRYAEILLIYAEACNALGEDAEAVKTINIIRNRAGLPGINSTGTQLRDDIRHERTVELMFEAHRYWDIRRWMIAPVAISGYAQSVEIIYPYGGGAPTFTPINLADRQRIWLDRAYFMPIQTNEMNRNRMLVQNPLYN